MQTVSGQIPLSVIMGSVSSSQTLEIVCQFISVVRTHKHTYSSTFHIDGFQSRTNDLFHRPLSVCKRDQCPVLTKPSCPAYKKLSVTPSECCDSYGCVCDCQNITRTCPPGYITNTNTNDCGCIEVTCTPDKVGTLLRSRCAGVIHLTLQLHVLRSVLCNQHVIDYLYVQVCVVDAVVYQVGSRWDEKCKTCTCTEQTDRQTGLHIAQCVDPVCNQICPLVRPTQLSFNLFGFE